jgi:hypothetical protein
MSTSPAESSIPATDAARPLPRWSLTLVAGVHALLFAWAGDALPWTEWSGFSIACYVLAAAHALTAIAAALRSGLLTPIWRVSSVLGLCLLGWLAWELSSSAAYLAGLYGALGEGLGAGLLAVIGLAALPTLPLSCWGLAATWRRSFNLGLATAAPVLLTIWTLGALNQAEDAHATLMPLPGEFEPLALRDVESVSSLVEIELFEALSVSPGNWGDLPEIPVEGPSRKADGSGRAKLRVPSLMTSEPIACVPDPEANEGVAVITFLALRGEGQGKENSKQAPVEVVSRCIRATPDELDEAIAQVLTAEAARGPAVIDVIRGVAALRSRSPTLDTFALRPGLDGVCDEDHCLMPWQLVALGQFIANEPLPFVPDFRYGISPVELRAVLGFEVPEDVLAWDREQRHPARLAKLIEADKATPRPAGVDSWRLLDGLTRIETLSYVMESNGVFTPLVRMHPRQLLLSARRLDYGRDLAEAHIAGAQLRSGQFRYTLDPFTGKAQNKSWNLPRQAGTTLVMCELGRNHERTKWVASRSLDFMAKHARPTGGDSNGMSDMVALTKRSGAVEADLGSTALPAIAFSSCRPHVGETHDRLIAGLARFLLAMQKPDGSFHPLFDLENGTPIEGPEPMYAGGQAIFALSLAEKLVIDEPDLARAAGFPSVEVLHEAVERAMNFYTGPYWDLFVRDFFYLEENWHCLAARASLEHHRNDAYERYCIDYMTYKSRVVLDHESGVASEFIGGYSMGNIIVPVNTPAAGYGEGLAAAMSLKHARGESLDVERESMRLAVQFLLRQQWTPASCFACAPGGVALGGFSESMGAAEIRIDYTQHAWAALGHGGEWLYEELPEWLPGDP